jgi:hypothetical protein
MRHEMFVELVTEAFDEYNGVSDLLLAERVKDIVEDHRSDEVELEDLDLSGDCPVEI